MSGRSANRLRAAAKLRKGPTKWNRVKKVLLFATPVVLLAAITPSYFTFFCDKPLNPVIVSTVKPGKVVRKAQTLGDLLKIPAGKLGDVDIAEMNLLCATGLPGAEKLDIDHALGTLDDWARRVALETDRHLYRVTDRRYADHYRHSEAYLRAEMLLQVLQQDLGIKYNMAARDNFAFNDSRVAFIHGMIPAPGQTIPDTPGGTCASMPVMYIAVGRRVGYPLKLVTTKAHIFVRWEGKDNPNPAWRERFNIEGSGDGFSSYEDEHYKTWPFKLSDQDVKGNGYLVSLTPTEEFAEFLAARGHCGLDNHEAAFAARCYENAYGYDPSRPCYSAWFLDAAGQTGYRPVIPALARLLAQRTRLFINARRPLIDGIPMPSEMGEAAPASDLSGVQARRVGHWKPQPATPGGPQSPSPYGAIPPQFRAPKPGVPNSYQPYKPPIPGKTPNKEQ